VLLIYAVSQPHDRAEDIYSQVILLLAMMAYHTSKIDTTAFFIQTQAR
jgi:hypothetical protein